LTHSWRNPPTIGISKPCEASISCALSARHFRAQTLIVSGRNFVAAKCDGVDDLASIGELQFAAGIAAPVRSRAEENSSGPWLLASGRAGGEASSLLDGVIEGLSVPISLTRWMRTAGLRVSMNVVSPRAGFKFDYPDPEFLSRA
jgi:hypothetical protein